MLGYRVMLAVDGDGAAAAAAAAEAAAAKELPSTRAVE